MDWTRFPVLHGIGGSNKEHVGELSLQKLIYKTEPFYGTGPFRRNEIGLLIAVEPVLTASQFQLCALECERLPLKERTGPIARQVTPVTLTIRRMALFDQTRATCF
jgi:hypothetical protein